MFDSWTWNLVQELSSAREFTVTEDHLKLLRRAFVAWDARRPRTSPPLVVRADNPVNLLAQIRRAEGKAT